MLKMKIKAGYTIRSIADQVIVVPTGKEALNFNGIITLNQSGKLLFEAMQNNVSKDELVNVLIDHYDVNEDTALRDIDNFIKLLEEKNVLEDE